MKTLDLSTWPRRKHFEVFRQYDYPYFSLCADVDVSRFHPWVKSQGLSFNTTVAYITARAANAIPELRQRIRGAEVVEHEVVHPSFTVLATDELFSFCNVNYTEDFAAFYAQAEAAIRRVQADIVLEDEPGRDDYLFMTSIPWVSFTNIQHPIHMHPADSVPRIAWGKYHGRGDRLLMPLSIQAHHALTDGIHAGRFYEHVQALLDRPEDLE